MLLSLVWAAAASGQGVSTAGIRGTVSAPPRQHVDGRVIVSNDATGSTAEARLTNGRFVIQRIDPGGPYSVSARALGFVPRHVEPVLLALGEMRQIDFV